MDIPNYIAVDWGTSSFRLWVVAAKGEVLAEHQGGFGMARLKPADFETTLEQCLTDLSVPADTKVIICGMAGAAQGWVEAPYLDVPVALTRLPKAAIRVPHRTRDIRILPGLAQREEHCPDVMRGEETLLLGAWLGGQIKDRVCMPGTHSKWAVVEDGQVREFTTSMTGEVFGLLAEHSTLSGFVDAEQLANAHEHPAFEDAVYRGRRSSNILQSLFWLRSASLLQGLTRQECAARLSGLLIGLEVGAMYQLFMNEITLIASGTLAKQYQLALDEAGMDATLLDSGEMARAGLHYAAKAIWPEQIGD